MLTELRAADPTADEIPTASWQTQLTIGAGGRISAVAGRPARPRRGDLYPVITAPQAFEALQRRWPPARSPI